MKDKLHEQLSALMDGELPDQEHELLIRRLKSDTDFQATWSRYHLIGDALRNGLPNQMDTHLAEHITQKIDREPAWHVAAKRVHNLWFLKPAAGVAVAASVAVMALIAVQQSNNQQGPAETLAPRLVQAPINNNLYRVSGTRWNQAAPEVETHLNGYLVNHSEYSSNTNLQGMLNYARIAGYDSAR